MISPSIASSQHHSNYSWIKYSCLGLSTAPLSCEKENPCQIHGLIGGFDLTISPHWHKFNQLFPSQRHASLFSFPCDNSEIEQHGVPSCYHLISCCKSTDKQTKRLRKEAKLWMDLLKFFFLFLYVAPPFWSCWAPGIAPWWLTVKKSQPTGECSPSQQEKRK